MADWDEMVLIGRVARRHGLKGQVVVNAETDFVEERFAPGSEMWIRQNDAVKSVVVTRARVQNGRPVVEFAGFDDVDAAAPLVGCELRIPETALRMLEDGRYYEHQLAGCVVETVSGQHVGTVVRVEGGIGASRLVVGGEKGEVLIPFVTDICPEIDVAARRIRIDPPVGLIELNAK